MKNVKMFQYNGYATNEAGKNFRAVCCGDGKGSHCWRLALETKPGYEWEFVNETEYTTCTEALADCELY